MEKRLPRRSTAGVNFYAKWMLFSAASALGLMLFRKSVLILISKGVEWAQQEGYTKGRLVISLSFLFVVCTYLSKTFWGFWYPGIAGWTYANTKTTIRPLRSDAEMAQPLKLDNAIVAALEKCVIQRNAKSLPQDGELSGTAMLLHYKDGTVLPCNEELFGMVFVYHVVRQLEEEKTGEILKHSLKARRSGRRFLLPERIAYLPHTAYMPISYHDHPDPDLLTSLTTWKLTLRIRRDQIAPINIINAENIGSIEFPGKEYKNERQ